jgi:hypothetical protein
MKKIQLISAGKSLCTSNEDIVDDLQKAWFSGTNPLLIKRYDAGDCDTIDADSPDMDNLKSALFDAREMGVIPAVSIAVLPNGEEIEF